MMTSDVAGERTVLFSIPHEGYLRNFIRLISELIDKGYAVHVALDPNRREDAPKGSYQRCLDLGVEFVDVSSKVPFRSRVGQWVNILMGVGIHYAHSQPTDPAAIRAFRRAGRLGNELSKRRVASRLSLPKALQWSRHDIRRIFERHDYHTLFISPGVEFGSDAWEWINAARRCCVPSMLLVASWDNLTNKSTLGSQPDWVLVWSRHQAEEARIRHGVPPERIRVIGSLVLSWHLAIETAPPTSNGHVIYAGSSAFLSAQETSHFQTWWRAVREDSHLCDLPIIVRLHPNGKMTRRDIGSLVAGDPFTQVFGPDVPDNSQSEIDFARQLDSAIAIVGVNTSAFIDAAIRGVPAFALDTPEVQGAQSHSEHFRSLQANRGVKLTSLNDHLGELTALRRHWPQKLADASGDLRRNFVFPTEPKTPEEVTCKFVNEVEYPKAGSRSQNDSTTLVVSIVALIAALLWFMDRSLETVVNLFHLLRRQLQSFYSWLRLGIRRATDKGLALSSDIWINVTGRQPDDAANSPKASKSRFSASTKTLKSLELFGINGVTDESPAILGPWTGEVGYELLYWTPLIDHLANTGRIDGAIPVSRGGTRLWYPNEINSNYLELFEIFDADEYRRMFWERQSRGQGLKSTSSDDWDSRIIARLPASVRLGLPQNEFFEFLKPFVYGREPLKKLLNELSFARIVSFSEDLPKSVRDSLPEHFVAVSLYSRPTLNVGRIKAADWDFLKAWCAGLPIIDIRTGLNLDDHVWEDLAFGPLPRPLEGCPPERNLAWQTDLVLASSALLTTHGGTAYLGLRCGKDVLAIQQRGTWIAPIHTAVAQHAARDCGASFSVALV